jgi:phosphohistidine phosphatase
MRTLILLRHAHAEPASEGQSDVDRALSAEGLAEAEAAGRWLVEQGLTPDRVLCSPARRTRETLEAVLRSVGYVEQRLADGIYEASAGALAELADEHREVQRLMLVGHNPGLERLAALLHSGQSGDYRGMPPGSVVVLNIEAEAGIEPGTAKLAAFWWP